MTALLDQIAFPSDLRAMDEACLPQLADELRRDIVESASRTGGHFGAGLGVVELTVALHYVFDTPRDRLIWDVSHQAYPHKALTGRRAGLRAIRKRGGLYGFTKRDESPYDPFGAGHSSTSISAGLGMAVARDLSGSRNHVVAVIGDGAIGGGMAYEALNHGGAQGSRLIVIVNDNGMSIAPAVGALPQHFVARRQAALEGSNAGDGFFSALGWRHLGPMDGHDLPGLVRTLKALRDEHTSEPVVLHVVTEKGRGHPFSKPDREKYHAVSPFDLETGTFVKGPTAPPSWTSVFATSLSEAAARDERIVAVTASMPSGTGLDRFAERFSDRMFDVGIAEQHAVTFAAGLASEGMKPFCAIYSTFLQRGFDQIVHDVTLQRLPVRFAIDRAGLVGQDGATHAGAFDLAYLSALPGFVVMAPADAADLTHMVEMAADYDAGPIAFRYPRGDSFHLETGSGDEIGPLEIGRGRIIREGADIAFISLGARLQACLEAARGLEARGIQATVADARFAKPIDTALIERLVSSHEAVILVEEGAAGGFSSQVLHHLARRDLLGRSRILPLTLPDTFIAHGSVDDQLRDAGLDATGLMASALRLLPDRRIAVAAGREFRTVAGVHIRA